MKRHYLASKRFTLLFLPLGVAALLSIPLRHAVGDTVNWDPLETGTSTGVQDGSGTWDNSTVDWYDTTTFTEEAWPVGDTADTAVFGGGANGTAGTVLVSGSQSMANLTFNTPFSGDYTLLGAPVTSGTLVVGVGANGTITVNGGNPTLDVPITNVVSQGKQIYIVLNNAANLTIGGSTPTTFYADNGGHASGASTGTLTFQNVAISSLTPSGSTYSFNRNVTFSGSESDSATISIAGAANTPATLSLPAGSFFTSAGTGNAVNMGTAATALGTLDISGSMGVIGTINVGGIGTTNATGQLIVESGGILTTGGAMLIGEGTGASGTASIIGTLNDSGNVNIGNYPLSVALLSISGSAGFGGAIDVGSATGASGATGTLLVTTSGTMSTSGAITLGGGDAIDTGTMTVNGVFNDTNGSTAITIGQSGTGTLNISGTMNFAGNGSISVGYRGSGTLNLNAGGLITTATGALNIATNPLASGTANLAGTFLDGNDINIVTTSGGVGVLNFTGGMTTIKSGRYLYINQANNVNGSSGTANISGGTLLVNGIVFGYTTQSGSNNAILNLTGGTIDFTPGGEPFGFHTGYYSQTSGPASSNTQANLGGGTFASDTAWSTPMNATLTASNGNVTFQASSLVGGTNENIGLSGTYSGAGGFIKTGGGTLTFGAVGSTNSYTGATVIAAGTLSGVVSGALISSTNIDVQSGATLDLSGSNVGTYNEQATQTIMGGGTIAGGTTSINIAGNIQPHDTANGIVTMNVTSTGGALTLMNNSTFALNLGATTSDQLVSTGTVNLGAVGTDTINLTINLVAQPVDTTVFTILTGSTLVNTGLFSYEGTSLANGALFNVTGNGYGEEFQITYGLTSDTLTAVEAVPEPGAWAMMASGLGLLLRLQRIKRHRRI